MKALLRPFAPALVVCALAAVLSLSCTSTASADPTYTGSCDGCTGTWTGTLTVNGVGPDEAYPSYDDTTTLTINWTQNVVNDGDGNSTSQPPTVSGSESVTSSAPDFQPSSCTITDGTEPSPLVSWAGPDLSNGAYDWDLTGIPPQELTLTGSGPACGGANSYSSPAGGTWTGSGCHWGDAGGLDVDVPSGGPHTVSDDCTQDLTSPNGSTIDETVTDSMTWQSTPMGGNGSGSTGTSKPPEFTAAKNTARGDLIRTLNRSVVYCSGYAVAAGAAGVGLISVAAGAPGLPLVVVGGLVSGGLSPLCGPAVTRIIVDLKTFDDPPLPSIHALAEPAHVVLPRLRACATGSAACTRLRDAMLSLDSAGMTAAADATAIEITVSREDAALTDGNAGATTTQNDQLAKLEAELAAAQAAETKAGAAVAAALRADHIGFHVTAAESGREEAKIEAEVVRHGVAAAQITAVDKSAFTARAANLLNVLR